jgi:hypothetical protein
MPNSLSPADELSAQFEDNGGGNSMDAGATNTGNFVSMPASYSAGGKTPADELEDLANSLESNKNSVGDILQGKDTRPDSILSKEEKDTLIWNKLHTEANAEKAGVKQGARNVLASIQNLTGHPTLGGLLPSEQENINARNQFTQQYGQNPNAQTGVNEGEILGTLPVMGVAGKALGAGASALGEAIPSVSQALSFLGGKYQGNRLLQLGSKAAAGAVQGAGATALTSADSNQPLSDQLQQGAKLGAGISTVLPVVGRIGKAVGNTVGNFLQNLGENNEEFALRKVTEAIGRDQISPEMLKNRLSSMGDHATIADAGGKNTLRLADTVANVPGKGQETISNVLNARHAGQDERLLSAATTGLEIDPNVGYQGAVENLMQKKAADAAPKYEAAFNANQSISSPEIDEVLQTPAGKQALKNASVKMQNDMALMGVRDPYLARQAKIAGIAGTDDGIASGLNLRSLDYTKRALDDQIHQATLRGTPDDVRILTGLKNKLTSALDKADVTGNYKAARSAYAGPSQSLEAVESGKNFIKNGAQGNAKELAAMSDSDKQLFRVGVGKAISDMLDGTAEGANSANALWAKPKVQKALASTFPTPEAFNDFSNTIQNEIKFYNNRRTLLGGSPTASRLAAMEDAGQAPTVTFGDAANAAKGNYGKALLSVGGKIKNRLTQMTPERANSIAELLFNGDQQATANRLSQLVGPGNAVANPANGLIGKNYVPITAIGLNNAGITNRLLGNLTSQ